WLYAGSAWIGLRSWRLPALSRRVPRSQSTRAWRSISVVPRQRSSEGGSSPLVGSSAAPGAVPIARIVGLPESALTAASRFGEMGERRLLGRRNQEWFCGADHFG